MGDDLPMPPRPPHHVRRLPRILTETQQQVLGSDLAVTQGLCLLAGQL